MGIGIQAHVRCPKCGRVFTYHYVPGGSLTAVRLGPYRYMRCMRCGRFALFNVAGGTSPKLKLHLGLSIILVGIAFLVGAGLMMLTAGSNLIVFYVVSLSFLILGLITVAIGLLPMYWRKG